MRTMNDTERIVLITKVLLYLKGPLSLEEIMSLIEEIPVNISKGITKYVMVGILRGKQGIVRDRKTKLYSVVQ